MKHVYIDTIAIDDTDQHVSGGLGLYPTCHEQVISQGGSWELVERLDGLGVGKEVLVLIDVPDHGALSGLTALDLEVRDKPDLREKLTRRRGLLDK